MATGWPMKTSYADGDVYSASDVNDITGTINLLQTSTLSSQAGKNPFINGGFDVWQRGTSVSVAASATATYTGDRFALTTQASQASTVSRQATGDTTNLPTIQYCARVQRNNAQTGTGAMIFGQSVETTNSIRFAGQTVTLSFYARKGANYSPTSSILNANIYTGTGTDQSRIAASYTGDSQALTSNVTLTTTWQRFTITGTLASNVTELAVVFISTMTGVAGAADYYEVTGVQLELGSYATTFSRNQGTIQAEFAACKRYFQSSYAAGNAPGSATGGIWASIETAEVNRVLLPLQFPVEMRTTPTMTAYSPVTGASGNWYNRSTAADKTVSSFSANSNSLSYNTLTANQTAGNQMLVNYTASAEL
jgi:hypothetical protein